MPTRYIATDLELTGIADAIRNKGGTSAPLVYPTGFISAINAIQTGGDEPLVEKDVNFIDYDGTLLYSYTKIEIAEMSNENELPANPSHTGLVSQGWNWTLAQIKAQLTAMPDAVPITVGQMYDTSSGATEIDIELDDSDFLSPYLMFCVNGEASVDWGDGSTPDSVTGSSLTSQQKIQHVYSSVGRYTIKISNISGNHSFYSSSSTKTILSPRQSQNTAIEGMRYLQSIKDIRIGSDCSSIDSYAFSYSFLETITIPMEINLINNYAFYNCFRLKAIVIPNEITSIKTYAFYYCENLTHISIPIAVTSFETCCFNGCISLLFILIPKDATSISTYAFSNCTLLRYIYIPNGIQTINNNTFQYCHNLEYVYIPNTVTNMGTNVFNTCYNLRNYYIPSAATVIKASTFALCRSIKRIVIPNTVESIEDTAFSTCVSLKSITIPSNVTSIGKSAFISCSGLSEIHLLPAIPPTLVNKNTFSNLPPDCIIYVPAGKLNDYQTAEIWSNWASQMQEEPAAS